jgi:hypothetical protein
MPPKTPRKAVYPMAFLNMAREHADAANELFMVADARPKIHGRYLPLSSPVYFLYAHAAELALKASVPPPSAGMGSSGANGHRGSFPGAGPLIY